ncbi:MAG: 3-phosphoshikimate 1-carboxyvinyltransferase, partial [Bacteroidia bacterium]
AQTAAVTTSVLKVPMQLNGLHTLRVKETDRILALQNELKKIGVSPAETKEASLEIKFTEKEQKKERTFESELEFETYHDHRMAMSFAPLALIYPEIKIKNPSVVKKSYPDYWNDMRTLGFEIKEENN